jgi:antirestriction protein
MTTPRIYVADLAAYNNGNLHGIWIDALEDIDTIWAKIRGMLKSSPEEFSEEHAIHDYEGFGGYYISEYSDIHTVHEIATFIEEHPEFGPELLDHCSELNEARRLADENYQGCYKSLSDYAEDFTEQAGTDIPDHLQYYIDYDKMGRDWELSGDIFTIETGFDEVHIFWSH